MVIYFQFGNVTPGHIMQTFYSNIYLAFFRRLRTINRL